MYGAGKWEQMPRKNKDWSDSEMTQQKGATRRTSGQIVQKWRVWGANPNKQNFHGPGP